MNQSSAAPSAQERSPLSLRLEAIWNIDSAAEAIEFKGKSYTWGQLRSLALEVDSILSAAGIGQGAPIGILFRNRPTIAATVIGLLVTGRSIVSINPFYSDDTLTDEIRTLKLAALIGDEADWQRTGVVAAATESGALGLALHPGSNDVTAIPETTSKANRNYRQMPSGIALEILTSGTTGKPKRLQAKYSALADAILSSVRDDGPEGKPKLRSGNTIVPAPLVHVSGVFSVLLSFCEGRSIVLLEKFDVAEWTDAVYRHKIRFASVPPTAMRMILHANVPKERLASLIAVRSGTAPLSAETQKQFEQTYGVPVLIQYSATEWLGGIAGWTIEEHRKYMPGKLGSVGRAQPGTKLRVVDPETGKEVPRGENGILEVLPQKRLGPEATWNRTTDLAYMDADDFLYIVGRADDVIIRGGFKVSMPSVAEVVNKHPAVKDSSVLGIPDDRLGEVPVCAVELRPGATAPSEAELEAFCREHLLPYQVPVKFRVVDALPRTVSMKVDRPATRALFA
jgi:long-chain acyl-CoA synthetase